MLNIVSSILAPQVPTPVNDYESIATTTLGTTASSVTFSSIAATYTHLQIRCMALLSASDNDYRLQFNGDTAANYSRHFLYGDGTTVASSGTANETKILVGYNAATYTNATASIIDILDYANTNKYKTVRSLAGADKNGGGYMFLMSGNWRNTAAVTSITLAPAAGTFNQYSSFALYGIKG
jgi:hypothetical protein